MNLKIQDFEGPFDLLLHLVKISKMDIYTINISEIINQYLDYIDSIKNDLDVSSEYLVMASELVHLKSRLLVNKYDEEQQDEEELSIKNEEDLRNKLIEYEKYKNITDVFKSLEENRQYYYTKLPENISEFIEEEKIINSDVSVDKLIEAFLELQKRIKLEKPVTTKVTRKEYSVRQRINEIRKILSEKSKIDFLELFDEFTKEIVVVTFLSLLDMSKNKEIYIKQSKSFSKITIEGVKK